MVKLGTEQSKDVTFRNTKLRVVSEDHDLMILVFGCLAVPPSSDLPAHGHAFQIEENVKSSKGSANLTREPRYQEMLAKYKKIVPELKAQKNGS